jgi:hypothetical protein
MQKCSWKAGSLLWLVMNDEPVSYSRWDELKKWVPSLTLLPIAIYIVFNRGSYGLIDNADLVIHEAGHFFFMFFGKFIYTAGGTLMQIIIPSLIIFYFFRNMYRLGVQIGMLWLGQNLINISVYAADNNFYEYANYAPDYYRINFYESISNYIGFIQFIFFFFIGAKLCG